MADLQDDRSVYSPITGEFIPAQPVPSSLGPDPRARLREIDLRRRLLNAEERAQLDELVREELESDGMWPAEYYEQ